MKSSGAGLVCLAAVLLSGCQAGEREQAPRGDGVITTQERQAGTAAVYAGLKELSGSSTRQYRSVEAVEELRAAVPTSSWEPTVDFADTGKLEVWTGEFVVCLTLGPQRDFATELGSRCR